MYVCGPSENNLIAQGLCFFAPPQELIELLQQEPLHNQNKERNVIVHLELGFSSKPLTSQSVAVKKKSQRSTVLKVLSQAKAESFLFGPNKGRNGSKVNIGEQSRLCLSRRESKCLH